MTIHCRGPFRDLVLASASPRRASLLEALDVPFLVDPGEVEEDVLASEPIEHAVRRLAEAKAAVVAPRHPEAVIVAADTLVECRGRILGKPHDIDEAREMLRLLSGATHRVVSGVAVLEPASGRLLSDFVVTAIRLREIESAEREAYLATSEPYDKASALAVQGLGGIFLEDIEGEFANVVGLPLATLNTMLNTLGGCLLCRSRPRATD